MATLPTLDELIRQKIAEAWALVAEIERLKGFPK